MVDMMKGMVASYLASPQGMEMIHSFISSKDGQAAIRNYLATPDGKKTALEILPLVLANVDLADDIRQSVIDNLPKK